ncbi:unnamed protein product [Ostreobium quekettii]|uniref:Uncharacterized protein n=1 Tax=Ostreobium quekettii TaxID=121088 RepID=A0A8S1IZZ9_9CHLO|nr:unnamed protein product [Ostreobium quekettii]|eukprot:evm.model.scf_682EXC.2 EVM.evm.TU.scf_682EXC.2   scf_682EXC:11053-12275(-)
MNALRHTIDPLVRTPPQLMAAPCPSPSRHPPFPDRQRPAIASWLKRSVARPLACQAVPQDIASAASAKLISEQEIPAFIPRTDIMTQLYRWANIEGGTNGVQNFGANMVVTPYYIEDIEGGEEGEERRSLWGFDVDLMDDGAMVCKVGVRMDTLNVEKPNFIGIGEDGFPVNEGGVTSVLGKNLQIWKVGDETVTDSIREVLRLFCTSLMQSVNKYYAFGSPFTDEL